MPRRTFKAVVLPAYAIPKQENNNESVTWTVFKQFSNKGDGSKLIAYPVGSQQRKALSAETKCERHVQTSPTTQRRSVNSLLKGDMKKKTEMSITVTRVILTNNVHIEAHIVDGHIHRPTPLLRWKNFFQIDESQSATMWLGFPF